VVVVLNTTPNKKKKTFCKMNKSQILYFIAFYLTFY